MLTLVLGLTLGADQGLAGVADAGRPSASPWRCSRRSCATSGTAPLIEPALRRIATLRAGAAATALYMASVGSEFYLLTLLLQSAKGYDALQAGLAFVPLAVLVTAGNAAAGRAVRTLAPATVLAGGFAAATAGLLWLALALPGDSYAADLLPGLLLSGFGHGVIYTAMFVIGTHDVPAAHQGTAGALLTTSQYLSAGGHRRGADAGARPGAGRRALPRSRSWSRRPRRPRGWPSRPGATAGKTPNSG